MQIITDKSDLYNWLEDEGYGKRIANLIDDQENSALTHSDYPMNQLDYLCARDVWENELNDELKGKVDIQLTDDEIIYTLLDFKN